jgi:prevent-host-death family protein
MSHARGNVSYEIANIELNMRSKNDTIKKSKVIIMSIATDIKSVTYLKSRAADLLKQINETHRPVIITQKGEPKAVLQDPKSYENMRNAIGILKLISQGEEDIKQGKTKTQEKVFKDIEETLEMKSK